MNILTDLLIDVTIRVILLLMILVIIIYGFVVLRRSNKPDTKPKDEDNFFQSLSSAEILALNHRLNAVIKELHKSKQSEDMLRKELASMIANNYRLLPRECGRETCYEHLPKEAAYCSRCGHKQPTDSINTPTHEALLDRLY